MLSIDAFPDVVPINDMHTFPPLPPPIESAQIEFLVQKDAQCSETFEKNNFPMFAIFTQNS